MKKHQGWMTVATLALLAGSGCGGDGVSDGTESEVAVAAIGGGSAASEGTVAYNGSRQKESLMARLGAGLSPLRSAWAVPGCSWSSLITACVSNSETISFDGCSAASDPAISIRGSETLAWSGSGCCAPDPLTASSATPCSFTRRTVNASGGADPMTRSVGANAITLSTEDTTGYSEPKSGGFDIACQGVPGASTCDGQRQISIAGAHYTGQSGRARWDHTVSTDAAITVQGHDATRRVLGGTLRVQNNLAQYTAITTVAGTLTYSSGCCFPTGGSVTTTFSGGKLDGKSETVVFGPTCGAATLDNSSQQQTGLTLHHCL